MAEVIPQITIDDSKVKETWVQNEVVTNDVYNAINKAVINLKDNNNLLDSNAMLFREEYNSSSKDLNNAIHQGVYSFTSSAVNAPSGVNGGNLLVTNTSKNEQGSSIITQIAFCHNGAVYARTKNINENFTAWNKLAYITDNVASATEAGNIDKGYINTDFPLSDFREVVLGRNNIGFCVRPFSSQFANGSYPNSSGVGFGAGDTHGYLQVNYVDAVAYIGGGNNNKINWYKKLVFSDGTGATGTWGINISGNANTANSATKATQDSQGQQINTTYVKGVTGSGATLTITKGNGTTNTVTINNVAHSTRADSATEAGNINSGFENNGVNFPATDFRISVLNRSGRGYSVRPFFGKLPNNAYTSSAGIGFGAGDTHGFLQCSYSYPIAYIGGGSANKINWSKQVAFTESPAFSGTPTAPTPSASDKSTKIATTAFVKSLFTASKQENGWWKDGNTGIIWQWGQEANYHDVMDNKYGSSGSLNFPISFPNKCLAVMPYLIGSRTFCCVSVSSFTNSTITVHWDEWSYDVQSVKFGYIAVGY